MQWIRNWTLFALLLLTAVGELKAQTFSEWFRQKKTQKRYLIEQVLALKVYTDFAKKGYGIVSDGLSTVRDITGGEFGLHEIFITGLKVASPVIRKDARISEVLLLNTGMLKTFGSLVSAGRLDASQMAYLNSIKVVVNGEILDDLEELALVIVSGKTEMTDDERLSRLNAIYDRTKERSAFVQEFGTGQLRMLNQQKIEQKNVELLRRWYEQN